MPGAPPFRAVRKGGRRGCEHHRNPTLSFQIFMIDAGCPTLSCSSKGWETRMRTSSKSHSFFPDFYDRCRVPRPFVQFERVGDEDANIIEIPLFLSRFL